MSFSLAPVQSVCVALQPMAKGYFTFHNAKEIHRAFQLNLLGWVLKKKNIFSNLLYSRSAPIVQLQKANETC